MTEITAAFEAVCRVHLDRFFATYPQATMQERAHKVLRMLQASNKPLRGKAEGWAAGILYLIFTDGRFPCGIPGILNEDFETLLHVSMKTARYRAARVQELVEF